MPINNHRLTYDRVYFHKKETHRSNDFSITEDPYKSHILIKGCLKENTLKHILRRYDYWNVIEWHIPAVMKGIDSQKNALEHDFNVVGYDPGSHYKISHTEDMIIFATFPNGIKIDQFNEIDIFKKNKKIVDAVLDEIGVKT